jgi:hypothetical protein
MNTELEVSNLLSGAKSFLRLISMAALLMVAVSDVALGVETPSTDIIASATKFMDLLVKEDFAGAVARFDTTMKNALPEPKMREVWQTLQKQVGPF